MNLCYRGLLGVVRLCRESIYRHYLGGLDLKPQVFLGFSFELEQVGSLIPSSIRDPGQISLSTNYLDRNLCYQVIVVETSVECEHDGHRDML